MSLPEVPEKLPPGDTAEHLFQNVLIGTVLRCEYGKGYAKFSSDNVTSIAILMDVLSKEMTKKRIKLEMKRGRGEGAELKKNQLIKSIEFQS